MRATNTIVIVSDEHNSRIMGCSGDPIAITPNLDAMALAGTRFSNAYCNSPVCVPSRASLATGRYVHQIGAWDSTCPYDGSRKGWAARLRDAGHQVVSIGKLHYRSSDDPNGFLQEHLPMHVFNGVGWLNSLLRDPPVVNGGCEQMAGDIGAGESRYTQYDLDIVSATCQWLEDVSRTPTEKPWTLYVGLVAPHFPLKAPQEFFDLYDGIDIRPPHSYAEAERPRHPVLDGLRINTPYDDYFDAEKVRIARQAYYGLCSFLDHNVGQILGALDQTGLSDSTRVIYCSDHGDNMGNRGLWGKSTMYEDSVSVPLIMRGPDLPAGRVEDTPVSLVDLHPTLTGFAGLVRHPDDTDLAGRALTEVLDRPDPDRPVFSEYHDWGAITGMFMLRLGDLKLIEYPGHPPQLFDLAEDPLEMQDLATLPENAERLQMMHAEMAKIVDADAVNEAAFADQQARIESYGGPEAIAANPDQAFTPPPT